MQKKKIENPKVFISYAWSTKQYEEKVIEFASRLMGDGIEVLLDKWSIDPGADTVNYMERCVKDGTVNYVLMLLDEKYAEKADDRKGGVGIETQIISGEVYNNVEQTKFIPIVFERDSKGEIHIPTYLKNRFHYDLTKENSEEEYVNLVKNIYGVEVYKKPNIGAKPSWVDEKTNILPLKFKIMNSNDQKELLDELLIEIKKIESYDDSSALSIVESYKKVLTLRNCLIDIFLKYNSSKYFLDEVLDFYENIKKWNINNVSLKQEIWNAYIHETFIYLIAVLFRTRKYKAINTVIAKSYFENGERMTCYEYFYSNDYNILECAKKKSDGKNYYSSMAQLWIENIYEPKISKADFVFSDLLIYNLTVALLDTNWFWFPITYVYDSTYHGCLANFSAKLKSKYELKRYSMLFGTNNLEEIKMMFKKMEDFSRNGQNRYRYPNCFECAEVFVNFVAVEEIGKYN